MRREGTGFCSKCLTIGAVAGYNRFDVSVFCKTTYGFLQFSWFRQIFSRAGGKRNLLLRYLPVVNLLRSSELD
jgi:hypothetical protein